MSNSEPRVVDLASSQAQLRAQVIERARHEPSATRAELVRHHRIVGALVLLIPLLLFVIWGGVRSGPRPEKLLLETGLGSAAIALGMASIALGRGHSMLGRPRSWLLAGVMLTPVLLLLWRILISSRYPGMMVDWVQRPGLRCFLLSSVLAAAPLIGVLWMRRHSDPVQPRLSAAAFGAAVGAGVWVLVDLWCPVGYVPHLLLGHVAPLIVITAAATLLGGRLLTLKRS